MARRCWRFASGLPAWPSGRTGWPACSSSQRLFSAALARTPLALVLVIGLGVALLAVRVLTTLVTLPVEVDASFSKALPILKDGGYVDEQDMPAVRSVLRAAAFTYLAGALISLVNLARWVRLLR